MNQAEIHRGIAELERRATGLIQAGPVVAVNYGAARVRVELDGMASAWLPWLAVRAGAVNVWCPPIVGEQVLVLCPGGDPAQGLVIGSLYRDTHAAPGTADRLHRTVYADGAVVEYDQEAHALSVRLPPGATARVVAPGGLTIEGDVTITGILTADDCRAGTVSLLEHLTNGVTPGDGVSGPPQT